MTNRGLKQIGANHRSAHYESLGLKTISKNRLVLMAKVKNGNKSFQLDIRVNVPQELHHNTQRLCLPLEPGIA